MTTEDRVRKHLIATGAWSRPASELTDDYALLDNGVMDSLGIMQMVSFLEDDLGIEIEDDDLMPENFSSIGAIAQLVGARRNS